MYTVMRKYDLTPGMKEQIIQDVQEHLVPILSRMPGFRAYSLVEVGDNEVAVTSTFDTFTDAKVSARLTRDWFVEHAEVFQEISTLGAGQVRIQCASDRLPPTGGEDQLQGVF